MKKILLLALLAISSIGATQIPETSDSIYYSPKYCDTAENTLEAHLTQWTWNGNAMDCIQPSEAFASAFYDEETGNVLLYLLDTYECCCQVASTPGMPGSWTFFEGSPCEEYLNEIGFTSLNESDIELDGIYIDPYGRQYTMPPSGLSIMNKQKYYRFN
jgi:hypothetical protein